MWLSGVNTHLSGRCLFFRYPCAHLEIEVSKQTMHQTRNMPLGRGWFLAASAWVDRPGPFIVWPSLWVDWSLDAGIEVKIHRCSMGWGRGRIQLDLGHHRPRSARRVLDWSADGLDGFLAWATEVFGGKWTRPLLEQFLQENPAWYRIIALGGPPAHYTRVLLARELFHRRLDQGLSPQPEKIEHHVHPPE